MTALAIDYDYKPHEITQEVLDLGIDPPLYLIDGKEQVRSTGLRFWQECVFRDEARFRVANCGRRSGKTILAVNELIRAAQTGYGKVVWYVAPTYRQAKSILWQILKEAIPKEAIAKKDETDLSITLKHYNSTISLKGADNGESLRGAGLDFLVVDEVQDVALEIIDTVLRPAMADKNADGLFIGTPKGMGENPMYLLFMRGKTKSSWKSWTFTTAQGGNVARSEIEDAKEVMSETKFKQEFLASFEAVQGRVYYGFDINETVRDDIEDLGGDVIMMLDFNVAKMCCAIGQRVADELQIHDEVVIENSNTREMCREVRRRYPNRRIICFPDPSGKARKTSAGVGQTDFSIIRDEFGFGLVAPVKAPLVVDRINCVNTLLLNASGKRKMFIHPSCEEVISCLDGQLYKKGTNQPDKDGGLDHMNDAIGYYISSEFNIIKREVKVITLNSVY